MRRATVILLLSVILYVGAWFVPVVADETAARLPGWEAVRFALSWNADSALEKVLRFGSGLSNLVFVAAVPFLWSRRTQLVRGALWTLIGAAVLNAHWAVQMLVQSDRWDQLGVGYYLWASSFVVLAFAAYVAKLDASPPRTV